MLAPCIVHFFWCCSLKELFNLMRFIRINAFQKQLNRCTMALFVLSNTSEQCLNLKSVNCYSREKKKSPTIVHVVSHQHCYITLWREVSFPRARLKNGIFVNHWNIDSLFSVSQFHQTLATMTLLIRTERETQ